MKGGRARGAATLLLTGALAASFAVMPPAQASPGQISTFAGRYLHPLSMRLALPNGLAYQGGELYFADQESNRVRKINSAGLLATVAGIGLQGTGGDGGPARLASLHAPRDLAFDPSGNMFILDAVAEKIRKVDTLGRISTLAPAFVFYTPFGIAADAAGNVYVSERLRHRVLKIDPAGIVTSFAGTGSCGYFGNGGLAGQAYLCGPAGMTFDASGALYVADMYNNAVRRVDSDGIISSVAGTTLPAYTGDEIPAVAASLNWPQDVAADSAGNLYIADTYNHRIRKIRAVDATITTVAGIGVEGAPASSNPVLTNLLYPQSVLAVGPAIYIADTQNNWVRRLEGETITTVAGGGSVSHPCDWVGDGGRGTSTMLCLPTDVEVDVLGNTVIADRENHRVRYINPGPNGIIRSLAGIGIAGYSGDGGPGSYAKLNHPTSVAIDSSRSYYITDTDNGRIRKVTSTGTISSVYSSATARPWGIAVDSADNLFWTDVVDHRIRRRATDGTVTVIAGTGTAGFSGDGGAAGLAQLSSPKGVAIDTAGDLYVADSGNHVVRRIDALGNIATVAGSAVPGFSGDGGAATASTLDSPSAVLSGPAGLLISDAKNARVRFVDGTGTIQTIAGSGAPGDVRSGSISGDGGPATSAMLSLPEGMAFDLAGNLLVADRVNDRIRKIEGPVG